MIDNYGYLDNFNRFLSDVLKIETTYVDQKIAEAFIEEYGEKFGINIEDVQQMSVGRWGNVTEIKKAIVTYENYLDAKADKRLDMEAKF